LSFEVRFTTGAESNNNNLLQISGDNLVKFTIALRGKSSACKVIQSTIIFSDAEFQEEFHYLPLTCEPIGLCSGSFRPSDGVVKHELLYSAQLLVAWETAEAIDGHGPSYYVQVKWPLGKFDFTQAAIDPDAGKKATTGNPTNDQLEDVFAKRHPENRSALEPPPVKMENRTLTIVMTLLVVLVPIVFLLTLWNNIGVLYAPIKNFTVGMTMLQKLLNLLLLAWFAIAVASWYRLDIFGLLKATLIMTLGTTVVAFRALRPPKKEEITAGNVVNRTEAK
jgi:hypothetical protein